MFDVIIQRYGKTLCKSKMPILPRIGEKINVEGEAHKIYDIIYSFYHENFISVTIRVE